jgi:hypothetical protein
MKQYKWYRIDSSNKTADRVGESEIRPMPVMSVTRVHRGVKPAKRRDFYENSQISRIGREERYARGSEVDWERVSSRQFYVKHFQKWEGKVVEIYEDTFVARLTDSKGVRMPRVAKIKKSLVNRDDWEMFFQKGFEFEWVFKEVVTNGTFSRKNEIRFTPITRYLPDEIDELVKRSMDEFSYMLKNND